MHNKKKNYDNNNNNNMNNNNNFNLTLLAFQVTQGHFTNTKLRARMCKSF